MEGWMAGKEISVQTAAEKPPWGPQQKNGRGQRWTFPEEENAS